MFRPRRQGAHMYTTSRRHLAAGLTALITISPLVPVIAWSVSARAGERVSECIDTVVFTSVGRDEAVVSRSCPGRIAAPSDLVAPSLTTIDIRNINP